MLTTPKSLRLQIGLVGRTTANLEVITDECQPPGRGPTTIVGTECFGMYCDSHEHSNMQSMNDYIGIKPNYKGAIDLPENVDRAAVAKRAHEAN